MENRGEKIRNKKKSALSITGMKTNKIGAFIQRYIAH